jgi:hypothetical protein
MKTPKTLLTTVLVMLLAASCSKIPISPIPIPVPPGVLQSIEQHPFQRYLDSVEALTSENIYLFRDSILLNDVLLPPHDNTQGTGQAEIGYAFRTDVAGAVVGFGIYVPIGGYTHTVTLWDSATGQLIAEWGVPSLHNSAWTTITLPQQKMQVIQPNHGYILGFNSLAEGNFINTPSPGNELYVYQYIINYNVGTAPNEFQDVFPFTEQDITFEGAYEFPYDTPSANTPFPLTGNPYASQDPGFFGTCDIAFIPQPQ